ncbi:AAA family ATPase [Methylorubrum suomiense]
MAELPQFEPVIDRILRPLAGQRSTRLPPIVLVGPPGCGKTRAARRLGEVLRLSPSVYSMGGANDSLVLGGVSRGWSTAMFCAPFREMLRAGIANPLIIPDEIDKAGTSRQNGNPIDVLIQLTGVESSARYRDPYLQADVDGSHVNWIMTANSVHGVNAALLDRCLVFHVDAPGPEHLRPLALSILAEVRRDRGLDERWAPTFDETEWAALARHWPRGGSLRALRRLVEIALDAREAGPGTSPYPPFATSSRPETVMTDHRPKRALHPVLEMAVSTVRGRDEQGLVRPELAACSLAVLRLGARVRPRPLRPVRRPPALPSGAPAGRGAARKSGRPSGAAGMKRIRGPPPDPRSKP